MTTCPSAVCAAGSFGSSSIASTAARRAAANALSGASMPPRIEAPQVSLESVHVTRIVDGKAELSVGLRLSNPNASALAIKAVDYEIMLDNRPAASGHTTVRVEVFTDDPDSFVRRAIEAGADGSAGWPTLAVVLAGAGSSLA